MPVGRGVLLLSPFMVAAHVGWWLSHRWGTWRSALAVAGALAALMGVWVLVWSCTSANYCAFPQALQMAVVVAALALVSTALGRSVAWPARAAGRGLAHLYRKVRHARDEN